MESIRAVLFLSVFFLSLYSLIQSIAKGRAKSAGECFIVLIFSIAGILVFTG